MALPITNRHIAPLVLLTKTGMPMLINLHTYYSLRYGTLSPQELVDGLLAHGYDTGVVTDINNSTAVLECIRLGRKKGLNLLAGMEFREAGTLRYIGIARNEQGFKELNEWASLLGAGQARLSAQAPCFDNVSIVYPWSPEARCRTEHEYIGIRPHERARIVLSAPCGRDRYVILAPVSFCKKDHALHVQLRAIDHNLLLSQLAPLQMARPDECWVSRNQLLETYRDLPHVIANTERLLSRCGFSFDFTAPKNKSTFTGDHGEDLALLSRSAMEGLERRYGPGHAEARQRIRRELEIIDQLRFSSYFLITDDICRFATNKGLHYVGRGSGANSLVAYCLGITDVCPIALDLYFERFLNPKRLSPPDFDIDFAWNERDLIYDYVFQRYPKGHVSLLGAMSTFQSRSIVRELGKVYGLPKAEIDRLVHEPDHFLNHNEVARIIADAHQRMSDFPNQRSIHASGVLISERPLCHYAALDLPPKGRPTIQFDMHIAERAGFEKFDLLSQRGIGHIKDCRSLVRQNQGIEIDTSRPERFFEDPHIAAQLRSANTIGCFYIESPAMRQLLCKLRCDDYLTLVAASSIIRPGVASSGMMKAYIERHHQPSRVRYPHPIFKEQLEGTYGVMVYQEDVMKIGHHFGGLDLADADVLRRMMSGKQEDPATLRAIRDKFFDHCQDQGRDTALTTEIWRQMESFAGYSFNKAHSASFAVESYQSLYLKTYFPIEFIVAVLNNYGGFYNRKVYVNEAKKTGATVHPPCVAKSEATACLEGKDIYLGFDCLSGLENRLARSIGPERAHNGPFTSIEDFVTRTHASLEQLLILIRIGAFRFLGIDKKALLWEAHWLMKPIKGALPGRPLFQEAHATPPRLPGLSTSLLEHLYDEIELIGHPVSGNLFDMAKSSYRGDISTKDMVAHEGKTLRMVGDFVADKSTRTSKGGLMKFGTFLDAHGDFFDTVHFSPSLKQYPLKGPGLYLLEGKVAVDFGCPSLEIIRCGKMPLKNDPRSE